MKKEREEIDEEIKKEVESLRNVYDMISIVETNEYSRGKILIPYLNGQASVCQTTLLGNITQTERYNVIRKLVAYQILLLEYIVLEDEPEVKTPEPPPADLKDAGEPW